MNPSNYMIESRNIPDIENPFNWNWRENGITLAGARV